MTNTVSATQLRTLGTRLGDPADLRSFCLQVVNQPFQRYPLAMAELFLGFMCIYLVDDQDLRFMGASDTEYYHLAIKDYPPFDPDDFIFPMTDTDNDLVRAITENKPLHSDGWDTIRRKKSQLEVVRLNQASSGIAQAYSYPLQGTRRGALMFNYYQYADAIGDDQLAFMGEYTELVSKRLA